MINKFLVKLNSGEELNSENVSWNDISEEKIVKYKGTENFKTVYVLKLNDVDYVEFNLDGIVLKENIEENEQLYTSILSRVSYSNGVIKKSDVGRLVGKIIGNEIVEEKIIDIKSREIVGYKY